MCVCVYENRKKKIREEFERGFNIDFIINSRGFHVSIDFRIVSFI